MNKQVMSGNKKKCENKKKRKKLKKYSVKKRRRTLFAMLVIFPLIIGLTYALPFPQVIAIESGDLLSYYATVFSILGSVYIFLQESKNRKKDHENELSPALHVSLEKENEEDDIFEIKIVSLKAGLLFEVFLYDQLICDNISEKQVIDRKITFKKGRKSNKDDCKVLVYQDDDLFKDKMSTYPDYIQIVCCDIEHNCWVCDFIRIDGKNGHEYYSVAPRIVA